MRRNRGRNPVCALRFPQKSPSSTRATVDILGVTRSISIDLTPQATVGDYVLVHAGFAIEVVSEQAANETLDLIRQFPEFAEDVQPAPAV